MNCTGGIYDVGLYERLGMDVSLVHDFYEKVLRNGA